MEILPKTLLTSEASRISASCQGNRRNDVENEKRVRQVYTTYRSYYRDYVEKLSLSRVIVIII